MTNRNTEPATASLAKSIALPHPPVYGGNGPIGGPPGTVVTIVGEYFINVEQVLFNGVTAQFTVPDSNHIRATVPVGATTGYITIITAAGSIQSNAPFTIPATPPPVYGGNGPIGGPPGTVVTIVGEYFINVQQVLFFNKVAAYFTVPDSNHIKATVPTGATTGNITIITATGSVQSNVPFKVT